MQDWLIYLPAIASVGVVIAAVVYLKISAARLHKHIEETRGDASASTASDASFARFGDFITTYQQGGRIGTTIGFPQGERERTP